LTDFKLGMDVSVITFITAYILYFILQQYSQSTA